MGKGGSSTSVAIPEWLETAAKRNLGQADKISRLGPVPLSYGPTVADFTDAQYAGFNNTANTASAFGLNAPGGYSMGNPAATTYDNGVRALSAAPLFEGKMDAFAAARPAQKSYIDSFFIDPYSGQYGSNMAPLVNYDNYGTFADAVAAANGGGSDGVSTPVDTGPGMAGGTSFTTYGGHQDIAHETIDNAFINYGKEITAGIAKPEDNPAYNADVAAANKDVPITYTTDDGNTVTKPAGELTSADFTAASNDPATQYALAGASMAAAGIKNVGGGYNQNDPTTGIGGAITDAFGNIIETVAETPGPTGMVANLIDAPNSTYDPTGGDNSPSQGLFAGGSAQAETNLINSSMSDDDFWDAIESDDTVGSYATYNDDPPQGVIGNNDSGSNTFSQSMANLFTPNDGTSYVDGVLVNDSGGGGGNDDNGGGGGDDDGCVIATHAVASGGFNHQDKRQAVVWCMHNLHDKWWGEAIRRGYRTLGRKKIEQGKAAEHYEEFRRYIDFASGKKRTLRGAVTFTLRSAQFFVVGILNKEA